MVLLNTNIFKRIHLTQRCSPVVLYNANFHLNLEVFIQFFYDQYSCQSSLYSAESNWYGPHLVVPKFLRK